MHENLDQIRQLLCSLGMHATSSDFNLVYPSNFLPVVLDGIVIGYVEPKTAPHLVTSLRATKL